MHSCRTNEGFKLSTKSLIGDIIMKLSHKTILDGARTLFVRQLLGGTSTSSWWPRARKRKGWRNALCCFPPRGIPNSRGRFSNQSEAHCVNP